jgi:hypothetical protein
MQLYEEIIIIVLSIGFSCLGYAIYKNKKDSQEINEIATLIVNEINSQTRQRSGVLTSNNELNEKLELSIES